MESQIATQEKLIGNQFECWVWMAKPFKKITIQAPVPFLKHGSTLLDTPGVDSTDPTHQNVTLEALFTTDAVLYVMDYNHVKAETNLSFF